MVERVGKDNRVSISPADFIKLENCEEDSRMVSVLAEVIAMQPRLLLLLCVLPAHISDYGEKKGQIFFLWSRTAVEKDCCRYN